MLPDLRRSNLTLRLRRVPRGNERFAPPRRPRGAFTLLELLMVVAIMAILTAALMPLAESTSHDMMVAAAQTVATDLAYARSLAVANNSHYTVHFDPQQNRYVLEHSGSNELLDTLPDSIFRSPGDPSDEHIVKLTELPGVGEPAVLVGAFRAGNAAESIRDVEFGPLGETTETDHTVVLLTVGTGMKQRYALVVVNPVTGLASVHAYGERLPSDISPTAIETITDSL
ncbi:MAG TPA: GspH/FimT family pseudopilin [Thermoguttaceae bacterium]|nr:GspH/FimT family pseudopilin [Thermoguttaceae bacterium]